LHAIKHSDRKPNNKLLRRKRKNQRWN